MGLDLVLKQHDTAPALKAALTDGATGAPVDLTTAATIRVIASRAGLLLFSRPVTPSTGDRTAGIVTCPWQTSDTAVLGNIQAEIEVTWSDGTVQTFPGEGMLQIAVRPDLG